MKDPLWENPDRSAQHRSTDPAVLRDQLNEAWKNIRIFQRAVSDRDRQISQLHGSVLERDKVIRQQEKLLKLRKATITVLYSLIGGAAAEGVKTLITAGMKMIAHR